MPTPRCSAGGPGARLALFVLTAVNVFNYCIRYLPGAMKQPLKQDLGLTDFETGLPATGMMLSYCAFAPLFAWMSDAELVDRRKLIACGVLCWSLGTSLTGLSRNVWQLVRFRVMVGVGEAAFATIVPPMLADFYPPADRNIAFAVFFMAVPVGGAVGFMAGGILSARYDWRVAFLFCGIPGAFAAMGVMMLNDPPRGANDTEVAGYQRLAAPRDGAGREWLEVLRNTHFLAAVSGTVAFTFVAGAIADWFPTFLLRFQDVAMAESGIAVGCITSLAGILGSILGPRSVECAKGRVKSPFFLVSALYTVPAAALLWVSVNSEHQKVTCYAAFFLALTFGWTNMSPISTLAINVMPVHLRARSRALMIFVEHALGDVLSPPIVGCISDATGSLKDGLQMLPVVQLVAGFCWWLGYQCLSPEPVCEERGDEA